jgi:hypothetical protein
LEERQSWLNSAGGFVSSARTLFDISGSAASMRPSIVLLCWQGVENDLKALSVGHTIEHTHNIGHLMDHLRDNSVLSESDIGQLSSYAAAVTGSRTYSDAKYPAKDPSYWSSLPKNNIQNTIFAAEQIHNFTRTKIASIAAAGTR